MKNCIYMYIFIHASNRGTGLLINSDNDFDAVTVQDPHWDLLFHQLRYFQSRFLKPPCRGGTLPVGRDPPRLGWGRVDGGRPGGAPSTELVSCVFVTEACSGSSWCGAVGGPPHGCRAVSAA